ncbi:hypothetical protein [Actinomadura sp. BRA 177]|uniref:hypothetical protein n=1 Tax=Actinomadura sp. BRA 177 TaxID=2745202 RepID=UPI0015957176|nr:hypothetical protein [Actinomadura sp. BRA 177]NVI90597.1 hypothetical protein [Actinomadura sp. BRA 177]
MRHRSRSWVRRRLRSLAWLELFNVPLQAAVWFGVVGLPMTAANMVGFTMFAVLLVVGAGYWLAKLRQISGPGVSLPGAGVFAVTRVTVAPLLAVGVLALVGWVVAVPGAGSWPGLGFGLFAVLEYVNYFHVQLMYDTGEDVRYLRSHGLRRAHLARDLAVHRKSRQRGPETAFDPASIHR